MTMAAQLLFLAGGAFTLLAAIGVVSFKDVLARMHALSKASTMGLLLVLFGGLVGLERANDRTFVLLAAVAQLMTSPVASNLMARATYLAAGIDSDVDSVDELAARRASEQHGPTQT